MYEMSAGRNVACFSLSSWIAATALGSVYVGCIIEVIIRPLSCSHHCFILLRLKLLGALMRQCRAASILRIDALDECLGAHFIGIVQLVYNVLVDMMDWHTSQLELRLFKEQI